MTASKTNPRWTLFILLLVAIIIAGGAVTWSKYRPSGAIEISLSPAVISPAGVQGPVDIYIDGAVVAPGLYLLREGDNVETLLQAAGGVTEKADPSQLRLYIPSIEKATEAQKIDLNRADVWLLKALEGVGDTLAQRIVAYRQQNGPFRNINELTRVTGIGTATLEKIKDRITVAD